MNKLPVGIQVYGLRDLLENTPENFENVMREVKELGYDGVELAGLYGLDPGYIREVLDRTGLVPVSAHVALAEMSEDLDKVIRDYSTIGVKYIAMPYLPEEFRPADPEGFKEGVREMERIGKKLYENGIRLIYHNHDFEFVRLPDGAYGYDRLFELVPPEYLACEQDTCWVDVAVHEPVEYLRKYEGRCPVVHLKDYIKRGEVKSMYKLIGIDSGEQEEDSGFFEFRPVGFGQQIWEPILEASVSAGAEWVVVEQDEHYGLSPVEAARRSREYLKILGW